LTLVNCTLTNNHAVRATTTVSLQNTILAGNTATAGDPDLSGQLTSSGYNLIGNTQGGSGFVATDLLNVNPLLGPLQNNGGPTPTMALLPGSPAINAGTAVGAPATDQRGVPRAGGISIGAFQGAVTDLFGLAGPSQATTARPYTFTLTAQLPAGATDTGYTGTVHFTSSDQAAGLPDDYTFTADDQGQHTFTLTFGTLGTQSVTATDTASAVISGTLAGVMVAAPTLVVGGFPLVVTPGAPNTFTVVILAANGQPDASYRGTVHFTSTDGQALLPGDYTFTAADAGAHVFGAVFRTAGTQSLTATDALDSTLTGTEDGIAVNASTAYAFVVTALPSWHAGEANTFTVTVVDAFGNVVTDYRGTVHLTSSDTAAYLPRDYTFTDADAGSHTFAAVLFTPGTQTLTAQDTMFLNLTGQLQVDVVG
jgi:hypothetical protein